MVRAMPFLDKGKKISLDTVLPVVITIEKERITLIFEDLFHCL